MITVVLLAGMRFLSQGLLLPVVEAEGEGPCQGVHHSADKT